MADRDKAKGIAQYRKMKEREAQLAKSSRVSLEGLAEQIKQAGMKDLNLILKGDVQGSVEVIAERCSGCRPRRFGCACCTRVWARLRSRTCCWRRLRTRSSSGSTCGLTASPPKLRSARTWRSGCTRSSTSCTTRSRRRCTDCWSRCSRRTTPAGPRCSTSSRSRRSARLPAAA